jgi:hypothetical protein
MNRLKPKEWHERHLAEADRVRILQHLNCGQDVDITKISVMLARQCDLFFHFQRLWLMRVSNLDGKLRTEEYMKNIFMNKRALYKTLIKS